MDAQRTLEEHQLSLTEPIALRPGQHFIVDGQHFTLRVTLQESSTFLTEITTPKPGTHNQHTQTNSEHITLGSPDNGYASEESVDTYFKCYIPPEIDESNVESVEWEKEIQRRITQRQRQNVPNRSRDHPSQQNDRTQLSTNIDSVPPYVTSPTVNAGQDIGNTSNTPAHKTSLTVAMHGDEEGSPRSGKEGIKLSIEQARNLDLSDCGKTRCHECNNQQMKQLVQTITLDELNPHGLYPNPDTPLSPQDITIAEPASPCYLEPSKIPGAIFDPA
jgi:hypothetical protein